MNLPSCFPSKHHEPQKPSKEGCDSSISDHRQALDLSETKIRHPAKAQVENDPVYTTIAKALLRLSLEERDRTFCEIHGVSVAIEDDLEKENRALEGFRNELSKHQNSRALKLLRAQDESYAMDRHFMLRFLFSEDLNPVKASKRFALYFELKLELFGAEKLCKDIRYEDLQEEDIALLRKGYFQILPVRDRAGRKIAVVDVTGGQKHGAIAVGRAMFWMFGFQPDQKEVFPKTKTKAVTLAIHRADQTLRIPNMSVITMYQKVADSIPFAGSSFFSLVSDAKSPFFRAFFPLMFEGRAIAAKNKVITGSCTEWAYSLMSYGIPTDCLPWSDDGSPKTKLNAEYLAMKRAYEHSIYDRGDYSATLVPLPFDVTCGKGRPFFEHMGNQALRNLLDEEYLERYIEASKCEKTALTLELIERVKSLSGRFLSKETGIWLEVPDKVAQKKVSDLFRTRIRLHHKQKSGDQLVPMASPAGPQHASKKARLDDGDLWFGLIEDGLCSDRAINDI